MSKCNHGHPQSHLGVEWGDNCPYCEIDRLKGELEKAREYGKRVSESVVAANRAYDKEFNRAEDLERKLAEAGSSGYWYERYKSCAEHLHLYTDGEEHGTADSCSFCTVVAEINGKLTEVQRQLTEARADNESMDMSVGEYEALQQARREGWEAGKAESITVAKRFNVKKFHPADNVSNVKHRTSKDIADAIATMEYKEKIND